MTAKLKKLDILPLLEQSVYNTAVLMLKSIWVGRLNMYATFLTERLLDMSQKSVLPHTRIDLYKMCFAFSGSSVWNSLPPKMKTCKSVRGFKVGLRKILTINEIVFRGIFGITMFVKLLCLCIYCFCFHYW